MGEVEVQTGLLGNLAEEAAFQEEEVVPFLSCSEGSRHLVASLEEAVVPQIRIETESLGEVEGNPGKPARRTGAFLEEVVVVQIKIEEGSLAEVPSQCYSD